MVTGSRFGFADSHSLRREEPSTDEQLEPGILDTLPPIPSVLDEKRSIALEIFSIQSDVWLATFELGGY